MLATRWGVRVDPARWDRLGRLVGLWQRLGAVVNLTGDLREEALWGHVGDGLACVAAVRGATGEGAWLDVGSGGGMPGLVVACAGWSPVVLLEPRAKRAAFLERAVAELGVRGVTVVRARWERSTWNIHGEGVGVLSARAVWSPEEWLRQAREVAGEGVRVVVHRGPAVQAGAEALRAQTSTRNAVLGPHGQVEVL